MTPTSPQNVPTSSAEPKIVIAVPARLGSTRLPRKPLALLAGRPLIAHVAERVNTCADRLTKELNLSRQSIVTLVATDSSEIEGILKGSGVQSVMTQSDLPSGTDRIEAAVRWLETQGEALCASTLIINLQGDEPFFCIEDIVRLVKAMQSADEALMGTLCFAQNSTEHFLRSSVVKVVRDHSHHALYFSRAPLPWPRQLWGASESIPKIAEQMIQTEGISFLQHIGIYAYRRAGLREFTKMPPSQLELIEGLEQLRALEAGWKIIVESAQEAPFGIDTLADLHRAEKHITQLRTSP